MSLAAKAVANQLTTLSTGWPLRCRRRRRRDGAVQAGQRVRKDLRRPGAVFRSEIRQSFAG